VSVITDSHVRESDNLIIMLKRYRVKLPFAPAHLEMHEEINAELRARLEADSQAMAKWEKAVEARDTVADWYRRLFREIEGKLASHFGESAPEFAELVYTGRSRLDTVSGLLEALNEMQADLANQPELPFAVESRKVLQDGVKALDKAIRKTELLGNAALESLRQSKEVVARYDSAMAMTKGMLVEYFRPGTQPPPTPHTLHKRDRYGFDQ